MFKHRREKRTVVTMRTLVQKRRKNYLAGGVGYWAAAQHIAKQLPSVVPLDQINPNPVEDVSAHEDAGIGWFQRLDRARSALAVLRIVDELTKTDRKLAAARELKFKGSLAEKLHPALDPLELADAGRWLMYQSQKHLPEMRAQLSLAGYALIGIGAERDGKLEERRRYQCDLCFRLPYGFSKFCREHAANHAIKGPAGQNRDFARRLAGRVRQAYMDSLDIALRQAFQRQVVEKYSGNFGAWNFEHAVYHTVAVDDYSIRWFEELIRTCEHVRACLPGSVLTLLREEKWVELFESLQYSLDSQNRSKNLFLWCHKILAAEQWFSVMEAASPRRWQKHESTCDQLLQKITSWRAGGKSKTEIAELLCVKENTISTWIERDPAFRAALK